MKERNEALLSRFRGPGECELCGRFQQRRECVHVYPKGMGGGFRLDIEENLLSGCRTFEGCQEHAEHHNQRPKEGTERLLAVVGKRMNLDPEEVRARIIAKRNEEKPRTMRPDQNQPRKPPTRRQIEQKARSLRAKAADYLRRAEALEAS